MNKIITFQISKGEDGQYLASADKEAIFTQGRTFEKLLRNIKEAIEASIDIFIGENKHTNKRYFPPVMMNMDFASLAHA